MNASEPEPQHIEAELVAAYLDGRLQADERIRVETHLAECARCRAELTAASGLLHGSRRSRWMRVVPVAAAAALALLIMWPRGDDGTGSGLHRGSEGSVAATPIPVAPRGLVTAVDTLQWSLARTDRYRVHVFDEEGHVLFVAETPDTFAVLPDSLQLQRQVPYYWKVEGRIDPEHWSGSALTAFTVTGPAP